MKIIYMGPTLAIMFNIDKDKTAELIKKNTIKDFEAVQYLVVNV